jgi:hypothetical protein
MCRGCGFRRVGESSRQNGPMKSPLRGGPKGSLLRLLAGMLAAVSALGLYGVGLVEEPCFNLFYVSAVILTAWVLVRPRSAPGEACWPSSTGCKVYNLSVPGRPSDSAPERLVGGLHRHGCRQGDFA